MAKSCLILENCIKVLNKVCFCTASLCLLCFKLGINNQIENILKIYLKFLVAKGHFFSYTLFTHFLNNLESTHYSNLLYETVLLINSIISIRSEPHAFMYIF